MIIKKSTNNFKVLEGSELKQVKASPKILKRMDKIAHGIKSVSPKSDDFLYFSIIFLKSAEAALLDEDGEIKKTSSGEKAWGYFDENWKWHGNVKPHRNNNSDIFPESELKKASSKWIGLPLCRDHESSSVDGVRGIILDTYYDEKFKQVVGLCALDRINYPDLARKVETGIVRFGSMGTAVERSVCSECCNIATTPDNYCTHVNNRSAYGEINVGLKPIEYSLVVQPAEPGAVLLKCIASLNKYKSDFSRMGIENVDNMLGSLSGKQAEHLDSIMKSACGDNGCSIEKRDRIVKSFLGNNGMIKTSSYDPSQESEGFHDEFYGRGYSMGNSNDFVEEGEVIESLKTPDSNKTVNYEAQETETKLANSNIKLSIKEALEDIKMSRFSKRREAKRKLAYLQGGDSVDNKAHREPAGFKDEGAAANNTRNTQDKQMQQTGSMGSAEGLFPGDLESKQKMSRADLKERSLRRNAYMQGGDSVDNKAHREPAGYKDEGSSANNVRNTQDKHMHQTGSMGSAEGLFPGDLERKQKISRAGSRNPISKKAGYTGPSLRTRLLLKKRQNGSVDRKNSVFQVFAGDQKVISVKARDIYGPDLNRNWRWLNSREYGQEVCKEVRSSGINYVKSILKSAQEAPAMPEMPEMPAMPEMGAAPEMPAMPEMGEDMPSEEPALDLAGEDMPVEEPVAEEDDKSPSELIDDKLLEMENLISEIQDLKAKMEDEKMTDVDVNVNVGEEPQGEAQEMEALAASTLGKLKVALAELDQTADEMAMVSETYENIGKLSSSQKRSFVSLASDAYDDSVETIGQSKAILSMASQNFGFYKKAKAKIQKKSSYAKDHKHMAEDHDHMSKDHDHKHMAEDHDHMAEDELSKDMGMAHDMTTEAASGVDSLIKEALELRKAKREAILKSAKKKVDLSSEFKKSSSEETQKTAKIEDELMERKDYIKTRLKDSFANKQKEQTKDDYKIKLRRAYDLSLEMQKKGLISNSKAALDRQVDDMMNFDSRAFEAFKRTVANTKAVSTIKVANDLGGLNFGNDESQIEKVASRAERNLDVSSLSKMWEK